MGRKAGHWGCALGAGIETCPCLSLCASQQEKTVPLQEVCMVYERTSMSQEQSESNQHNTHPGSKLKNDGRVIPHGEASGLAPRSLAELLHSTAIFPCFQMEQELLDLLYRSEGGRVDKIMRERDESPQRKEFHHYLWVLVSFLVAVAPEIAP